MTNSSDNIQQENATLSEEEIILFDKNGMIKSDENGILENSKLEKVTKVYDKGEEEMSKTTNVEKEKLANMLNESERLLTEKLKQQTEVYDKLEKQAKSVGRVTFSKMTDEEWQLLDEYKLMQKAVERTRHQLEETQANRAAWLGQAEEEKEED